jgi:hypothetical protein
MTIESNDDLALPAAQTSQSVVARAKPEILTTPPILPAGTFPDEINLENAIHLDGLVVAYTYSSGRAYMLTFYDDRVSFEQRNTPAPVLSLPYRARAIAQDIFLVHWLVPGRIGHVSLILDLVTNRIHGSALMPGQMELFEEGPIVSVHRGG